MDYLLLHLIVHLERLSRPLSRLANQGIEVERYLSLHSNICLNTRNPQTALEHGGTLEATASSAVSISFSADAERCKA